MSLTAKPFIKAFQDHAIMGPAAILFISANIANAANLAFNMIFARILGPVLFADLTLLLTLKLGALSFLSALQFAISEQCAKGQDFRASKAKAFALSWQSLKISIPVMFMAIASSSLIASWLNFSSPWALAFLALSIPFFLPVVIYRGLTQGLINTPKIVFSIQSEWIIRLIGSLILWKLGLGLPGIAVAVGLSIIAAFIFSTDKQDWSLREIALNTNRNANAKAIGVVALPYLILQVAQVVVLDSDIIIAKTSFSAQTAGLVAGLLLIQRIFFFAFLSCSTILQPFIAKQKNEDQTPQDLFALLLAIAAITATALAVIIPNSDLVIKLMLGDEYTQLSPIVWISALTGAVFIISHLCAIYQITRGQKLSAQIVLGFGFMQLVSLSAVHHLFPDMGLQSYFSIKLAIQIVCAACLLGLIILRHNKPCIHE